MELLFEFLHTTQAILERGIIFWFVVAAVWLSSQLLKFDNLAIEGAFGLGGAVTAFLIVADFSPILVLIAAFFSGVLSGVFTALLHRKVGLNNLISGIVVTTGLFSILLKIAGSHQSLAGHDTIFTLVPYYGRFVPVGRYLRHYVPIYPLFPLMFIIGFFFSTMRWLLTTEFGYLLHAVGDNRQMITNLGKSVDFYLMAGLGLSNGFAAVAGSLFVQYTGYFSIWTGVGMLVIGLAGMIIAQTISKEFGRALAFGSILYQLIITLTIELQLDQDWNKAITALLIVLLIVVKQFIMRKEGTHA